ncbi:Nif11-like leader peptide family RiPP precursor [Aquabacter sp. L1I39]|uniref:Nif11-like leader peptide family RiPP precursor n=1 Tax=Aquabacter sp. L1I39 TaxID=2820278 RepID=UPI001ADA986F|nr:Nif11-like leader peptide family RiPP precursor [Aquabacter sp. L1I39]QTL02354.1 Nif11-like leader peptide family RiPP precursor [Aquabacter sp. L1I39]
MSHKLSAFLDAVETDPEVLSRVRAALPENAPLTADMFVKAAHAAGFALSREDLPFGTAALDERALEELSGGVRPRDLRTEAIPTLAWQAKTWRKVWNKLFG